MNPTHKWASILAVAALAAGLLVGPGVAAGAGPDVDCSGALAAGTYHNVTALLGCVTGPAVTITGDLTVVAGGTLHDTATTIDGNLHADHALWIELQGVSLTQPGNIGGNLEVTATTSHPPDVTGNNFLCNTVVGGNVQVQNNSSDSPFVIGGPDTETAITQCI